MDYIQTKTINNLFNPNGQSRSNDATNSNKNGNITPLILFQPFNLIVFLSFYSPIILAISITSLSFLFQNFKGFIYLAYLIGVCIVRNYAYMLSGGSPIISDKTVCTSIQYSKYGNSTFSAFVFAFTMTYLLYPMFANGSINFWIVSVLFLYFFVDIFIKTYKKCVTEFGDMFLNILLGIASSALIVTLMYSGGSSKYLFFNETQSNKDVCSMPSTQTFKCNVYKNGELIGNI
jgi:hypothetical protein